MVVLTHSTDVAAALVSAADVTATAEACIRSCVADVGITSVGILAVCVVCLVATAERHPYRVSSVTDGPKAVASPEQEVEKSHM